MLTTGDTNISADEVTLAIYKILRDSRVKKDKQRQENIEFYKSVWGNIPNENTE